jgi:DNA-binding NarL/FixJ family response regulator
MKKYIIIVEDNEELKNALIVAIESTQKYKVLQSYSSAEAAIAGISTPLPDVIIMDIELNGKMDGIGCTSLIKKKFQQIDILMLTVFEDSDQVFEALRAGACGYMTKNCTIDEIINALDQACQGGAPMSFKIARMVLNTFNKNHDSPLTEKEYKILNLLAKGGSYKTTANQLNIATETVKSHIKNIYIKLQVNSKEDAIEVARRHKYIN